MSVRKKYSKTNKIQYNLYKKCRFKQYIFFFVRYYLYNFFLLLSRTLYFFPKPRKHCMPLYFSKSPKNTYEL